MKLAKKTLRGHLLLVISVITFFGSCQKQLHSDNIVPAGSHLVSVYSYGYGELHIDSFSYNGSGYLTRLQQWTYDSTGPVIISDSADFVFSFPGAGLPASSFTLSSLNAGTSNPVEKHMLFYDNKNRIIKDSLSNAVTGSKALTKYSYETNYIVSDNFLKNNSGLTKTVTDSFFIAASNNITNLVFYNSPSVYGGKHIYTYSSDLNPFHDKVLTENLGIWLTLTTDNDFISQNTFITITVENSAPQPFTSHFTWSKNPSGKVVKVQQVGKDVFQTFHYSN